MSLENLIPFVLFLLYVVAIILKRTRRAARRDRSAPPAAKPEWREKLDRYMDQLKAQMEPAAPAQESAGREAWDRLAPTELQDAGAFPAESPEVAPPPAPAAPAGPAAPPRQYSPAASRASAPPALPPEDSSPTPVAPAHPPGMQPLPAFGAAVVDPGALRAAVIWSEILGPPLALREK